MRLRVMPQIGVHWCAYTLLWRLLLIALEPYEHMTMILHQPERILIKNNGADLVRWGSGRPRVTR